MSETTYDGRLAFAANNMSAIDRVKPVDSYVINGTPQAAEFFRRWILNNAYYHDQVGTFTTHDQVFLEEVVPELPELADHQMVQVGFNATEPFCSTRELPIIDMARDIDFLQTQAEQLAS